MKLKELRPLGISMAIAYVASLGISYIKMERIDSQVAGMLFIYVLVAMPIIYGFLAWLTK